MYPFPYFRAFIYGTPVIPDIYWNCYSYEERIKKLCMEYDKLCKFTDAMVDAINEQHDAIDDIDKNLGARIADALANDPEVNAILKAEIKKYIDSMIKGTTYKQIKDNGFMYKGV